MRRPARWPTISPCSSARPRMIGRCDSVQPLDFVVATLFLRVRPARRVRAVASFAPFLVPALLGVA
jgi:hypothetical protein